MMQPISFFIPGTPAPGGSKRVIPRFKGKGDAKVWVGNCVTDDAKGNKDWKQTCARYAREFMRGSSPIILPLEVRFTFFIQRPKFHFGSGKNEFTVKPSAPRHHTVKPDALKFARSTEDALTGIVWIDDAQTVCVTSRKRYCGPADQVGCMVYIKEADEACPMYA